MSGTDDLRIEAAKRIDRVRHVHPSTRPIAAVSLFGLAWLLTAPVVVAVAVWRGTETLWGDDAPTLAALCTAGLPAALAALAAAGVAVRCRGVLSWFWIAAAFLPWAISALGAAFVVFVVAVR